ncbi:plasmid pRiA4b ORF-3 family protein [Xanthomonas citri]|uniref:plasmid pRiA4b ORF-3 family protein n=1 Tax=Xanthomonas citri TaxID=346 RepID=UPI003CCF2ACD
MTMRNPTPVWRLKVELLGVAPAVWRRFDTHSDAKLAQLHYFIQGAMGWELMHLFSYQDGRGYGGAINSELRLCDVCRIGDALTYTYDFGDNWQHRVTVEKAMARPTGTYPCMVAGKYACPPEDCGGSWGYADLLRVLAGHRNARRRELIEWLGGPFDPKVFDMDEAQKRLSEYVEMSMPKNHQPTA